MDTVARETGFSERAGRRPQPSRKGGRQGNSRFPIIPFYAVLGFLAVSVAATVFGSVTGVGKLEDPFGKPQAIRDIVISGGMDLPIEILDAHSGKTIATYPVGEGGFVRGSLRDAPSDQKLHERGGVEITLFQPFLDRLAVQFCPSDHRRCQGKTALNRDGRVEHALLVFLKVAVVSQGQALHQHA